MYIFYVLQYTLVQPGETLPINLLAIDQVGNSREAVWSLEAPRQDAVSHTYQEPYISSNIIQWALCVYIYISSKAASVIIATHMPLMLHVHVCL